MQLEFIALHHKCKGKLKNGTERKQREVWYVTVKLCSIINMKQKRASTTVWSWSRTRKAAGLY